MTGSGSVADPYVIWDVVDLQNVELDLTAYYELGCDIDASATIGWNAGQGFAPLGMVGSPPVNAFVGYFDGKGHKITGLFINRVGGLWWNRHVGLFRYVGAPGYSPVIQNLTLESVNFTGEDVGGLIQYLEGGTVRNVSVSGSITATDDAGGLIEYVQAGDIDDCSTSCSVTATDEGAGLIRYLQAGTVDGCYTTGTIIADDAGGLIYFKAAGDVADCYSTSNIAATRAGGLVGVNSAGSIADSYATGTVHGSSVGAGFLRYLWTGTVSRCRATGNVSGDYAAGFLAEANGGTVEECYATGDVISTGGAGNQAGGFGAYLDGSAISDCYARGAVDGGAADHVGGFMGRGWSGSADNCYSTGLVTGAGAIGGFLGTLTGGTFTDCFWDTQTSGQAASAAGTGKTTAAMKTESTFTIAGWDFAAIWLISTCNDSYPCLRRVTPGCVVGVAVTPIGIGASALPATNITDHTATINGVIDAVAVKAQAKFQWGGTKEYGVDTAWQGGLVTGDQFHCDLTRLAENTVYHYRVVAMGSGVVYSNDVMFITSGPLGPVTLISENLAKLLEVA